MLAITFGTPGLLYLYYGYSLLTNEMLRGWDAQREGTVSPPWPHWLIAFGPLLLLALLYAWQKRWGKTAVLPSSNCFSTDFLWVWILAAALLVYAPLNSQRRFVQGVHVPLSILAALGFVMVVLPWLLGTRSLQGLLARPRYSTEKMSRFITALFILFMGLSNLYLFVSVTTSAVIQQPDPLFRPVDEVEAVAWLRENGDTTAVLLGDYQTGNYVAAHAGNQVVIGHWAETINYDNKEAAVAKFFDVDALDDWRQELLEQYTVTYVWYGPREQALGEFDPETADYLQPFFTRETITIYQVRN